MNAPGVLRRAVLRAQGERQVLLLHQRLHRAQIGEGWVDRHVQPRDVVGLEPQPEVAHGVQRLDVVVVHLPVPAHERAPGRHPLGAFEAARSASIPGRCPSDSMKDSDAPPPVDR